MGGRDWSLIGTKECGTSIIRVIEKGVGRRRGMNIRSRKKKTPFLPKSKKGERERHFFKEGGKRGERGGEGGPELISALYFA